MAMPRALLACLLPAWAVAAPIDVRVIVAGPDDGLAAVWDVVPLDAPGTCVVTLETHRLLAWSHGVSGYDLPPWAQGVDDAGVPIHLAGDGSYTQVLPGDMISMASSLTTGPLRDAVDHAIAHQGCTDPVVFVPGIRGVDDPIAAASLVDIVAQNPWRTSLVVVEPVAHQGEAAVLSGEPPRQVLRLRHDDAEPPDRSTCFDHPDAEVPKTVSTMTPSEAVRSLLPDGGLVHLFFNPQKYGPMAVDAFLAAVPEVDCVVTPVLVSDMAWWDLRHRFAAGEAWEDTVGLYLQTSPDDDFVDPTTMCAEDGPDTVLPLERRTARSLRPAVQQGIPWLPWVVDPWMLELSDGTEQGADVALQAALAAMYAGLVDLVLEGGCERPALVIGTPEPFRVARSYPDPQLYRELPVVRVALGSGKHALGGPPSVYAYRHIVLGMSFPRAKGPNAKRPAP